MRAAHDYLMPRVTPLRFWAWRTPATPLEDDPHTLARLAAIMSDRVVPCPICGADPYICRAIGCDAPAATPLRLSAARA